LKYDNNFTPKLNIRVFNSDFIKENLKLETDYIEPILLLGGENIALQNELNSRENEQEEMELEVNTLKKNRQNKDDKIEKH
jgi:hypothetical protein